MSASPINLSPDLGRLVAEGFELEIVAGHLVIRNVPFVDGTRQIRRGALISELKLAGNVAQRPATHVIMFAGGIPCDKNGRELVQINQKQRQVIDKDLTVECTFSSKPPDGYANYYEKLTVYVAMIVSQAQAIDPDARAETWRVIASDNPDTVFNYIDNASSRAGITAATRRLQLSHIAIVGLGGTGSYVLDLIAKTPVRKLHLFDGDKYGQHNAFRSPGAPSIDELRAIPYKVDYWKGIYSRMRRGIEAHPFHIDAASIEHLRGMDFVFLCADAGSAKLAIIEQLEALGTPFADTGMGLDLVDEQIQGVLTVTTSTKDRRDHVRRRVSFDGDGHENLYARNIQVADLNALNAALAVVRFKKHFGFYTDFGHEYFTAYTVDGNAIANEER